MDPVVTYDDDTQTENYYVNGVLYRKVTIEPNIRTEQYFNEEGELHREDGPAESMHEYEDDEEYVTDSYYCNGKLHNEKGPAEVSYLLGNQCLYYEYYINDVCHRLDGPAHIEFDEMKNVEDEEYFINGHRITNNFYLVSFYVKIAKRYFLKKLRNANKRKLEGALDELDISILDINKLISAYVY